MLSSESSGRMSPAWSISRKAVLGSLLVLTCASALAQARHQAPVPQSDLARQNMERVAASVGQLVAILHRDPGLMVELKRWIAKDATDHGQLISDSDLTDEAIFDRLENDITFRSVATNLVQKYGFLKPILNPESPQAQEQQLLIRERARYMAQDEARSRQQQQQKDASQSASCDPTDSDCSQPNNAGTSSIQEVKPQPGMNNAVPGSAPSIQNSPGMSPTNPSPNAPTNDVTLMRTSGDDSLLSDPAQAGSSSGQGSGQAGSSGSGQDKRQGGSSSLDDLSLNSDFAGEMLNPQLNGSPSGLSGTDGSGVSTTSYTGANSTSANANNTPAILADAKKARESVSPTQKMIRAANPYENDPFTVRHVSAGCSETARGRAIRNADF